MLPASLMEASQFLNKDKVLTKTLGDHVMESLNCTAQMESDAFRLAVHPWNLIATWQPIEISNFFIIRTN